MRARSRDRRPSAGHNRRPLSAPHLRNVASGGGAFGLARVPAAARRGRRFAAARLRLRLGGGGLKLGEEGVWGGKRACVGNELRYAAAGVAVGVKGGRGHWCVGGVRTATYTETNNKQKRGVPSMVHIFSHDVSGSHSGSAPSSHESSLSTEIGAWLVLPSAQESRTGACVCARPAA